MPRKILFKKLKPIWSLSAVNRELYRRFMSLDTRLDKSAAAFESATPLPATCAVFNEAGFFRLGGHARSIYYKSDVSSAVIAIKGGEPFATDYEEKIQKFCAQPVLENMHNITETFLLVEQKIPLALTREEAMSEAQKATFFQQAYYARYGELAPIPLPLYVFQVPTPVSSRFFKSTRPHYSQRARSIFDALSKGGLAVYLYYYPNLPVRVNTLQELNSQHLQSGGFLKLLDHLETMTSPFEVVDLWIKFVVRMLSLGFFPCTASHNEIGQMVRMQNAVIDGGFVDCDSIQSFSEVKSDKEFLETFWTMLIELEMTIRAFLVGKSGYRKMVNHDLRMLPTLIFSYMRDEFSRAMAKEKRSGSAFDPRIERMLRSTSFKDAAYGSLNILFPAG